MRSFWDKALLFVMLLILPLVTVLNIPRVTNPGGAAMYVTWGVRFVIGCAVLLLAYRYTRAQVADHAFGDRTITQLDVFGRSLATELQREAAQDPVSQRQATLFIMAIRTPAKIRQRIVEKYVPGQRTLSNKGSIEIQVPRIFLAGGHEHDPVGSLSETFPFPIFVSPKGLMYDNLEIFDCDGARLSTLSHREYLGLVAGVLRYLLAAAYGGQLPQDRVLYAEATRVELDALELITKRRNDRRLDKKAVKVLDDETAAVVARVLDLEDVPEENRLSLEIAADVITILSKRYAIVAPLRMPANGRTLLTYKRSVIPALKEAEGQYRVGHAKEYVRHLIGARPVDVRLALDNAGICHSYHIEVQGPDGLYLANQRMILEAGPSGPAPRSDGPGHGEPYQFKPYYRFRSRLGQSYAHFYGRHFPSANKSAEVLRLEFSFYEVPPGSDFSAAVAAASAAFLIGLIGFVLSHSIPDGDGKLSVGSDAAVLLLAFPGVAASWLGIDQAGARLFDSSLSARISLIGTAAFSVAASALYIINSSGIESQIFGRRLGAGVSLLGINRAWWVGLTALAVINTLCIAHRWLYRSWRYAHLAQRNPSG